MTCNGEFVFGIDAFGSSISVECADAEVCKALQRYIFPPLPRIRSAAFTPDISLCIRQSSEGLRIELNHELVASVATLHDAALAAVKALDELVVHRMKELHAVHAGTVLIDGRALLLPGSTYAGKSSIVAELLRRGASHFSDEYALIDNQGRTHSYPRPLLLRNGRPLQSLVLPEELNASFASDPAPVGWIMALDYVPGESWNVQEISQAQAVMLLLRNTPHQLEQSPAMVDFFLRVAGNAHCYAGTRCDVVEAVTHILDLIRRR